MNSVRQELFLHIGHSKTGTTFVQNALALSARHLTDEGISYPISDQDIARIRSRNSLINSGNGSDLLTRGRAAADFDFGFLPKVVFSSELMFPQLETNLNADAALDVLCQRFDTVHVLLFVRNPIEFGISAYQQMVKRHGHYGILEDFVLDSGYLTTLMGCLNTLQRHPRVRLSAHNYSREKHRILNIFENWIGVPKDFLDRPDTLRINRSLTAGELRIQRLLNRHIGTKAKKFSDLVCETFPNRPAANMRLSPSICDAFMRKYGAEVERINALLPGSACLETC